jgi:hypothetical protein
MKIFINYRCNQLGDVREGGATRLSGGYTPSIGWSVPLSESEQHHQANNEVLHLPWGICIIPTVSPDITSLGRSLILYFLKTLIKGKFECMHDLRLSLEMHFLPWHTFSNDLFLVNIENITLYLKYF